MTTFVNPLPPDDCDSPRVPPSAEQLASRRSDPTPTSTSTPVSERIGIDALRMDVVAAPGASVGPCTADESVDVVNVPGRPWGNVAPGHLGRLDATDSQGFRPHLAILTTAPNAAVFQQALDGAEPLLDSFEFHEP